ncbi:MAG: hypothetical protein ACM3WP_09695 [Acidobacteriota bacterium]
MFESLPCMLDEPWKPVSRPSLISWLVFYLAFLAYAFSAHGGFLFIDSANLIVHEGGHNLFGWFGPTIGLWGGTLLQWLVPFLLAAYFFTQRQLTAFVFCGFFFFENWLYTATYMADARAQILPLVTTGDPDFVEHDFHAIFSKLGLLDYDTTIALVVRGLGWCGMLAIIAWSVYQASKKTDVATQGPDFLALRRLAIPKKDPAQMPLSSVSEEPARDAAAWKKASTSRNPQ